MSSLARIVLIITAALALGSIDEEEDYDEFPFSPVVDIESPNINSLPRSQPSPYLPAYSKPLAYNKPSISNKPPAKDPPKYNKPQGYSPSARYNPFEYTGPFAYLQPLKQNMTPHDYNYVPVSYDPVNDVQVNGVPFNNVPVNSFPVNGVLVNGVPVNGVLVKGVPLNGPVNGVPVKKVPINGVPIKGVRVPVKGVPVNYVPLKYSTPAGKKPSVKSGVYADNTKLKQKATYKTHSVRVGSQQYEKSPTQDKRPGDNDMQGTEISHAYNKKDNSDDEKLAHRQISPNTNKQSYNNELMSKYTTTATSTTINSEDTTIEPSIRTVSTSTELTNTTSETSTATAHTKPAATTTTTELVQSSESTESTSESSNDITTRQGGTTQNINTTKDHGVTDSNTSTVETSSCVTMAPVFSHDYNCVMSCACVETTNQCEDLSFDHISNRVQALNEIDQQIRVRVDNVNNNLLQQWTNIIGQQITDTDLLNIESEELLSLASGIDILNDTVSRLDQLLPSIEVKIGDLEKAVHDPGTTDMNLNVLVAKILQDLEQQMKRLDGAEILKQDVSEPFDLFRKRLQKITDILDSETYDDVNFDLTGDRPVQTKRVALSPSSDDPILLKTINSLSVRGKRETFNGNP